MEKQAKEHEKFIIAALNASDDINNKQKLIELHLQKIHFLQHERLIHLLVTIAFMVMILFSVSMIFSWPHWGWLAILVILLVTELFYLKHYYFLENTVQRWYLLDDQLRNKK